MVQQVMIIGSDLNDCKYLKYELQDEKTQVYYVLSLEDGIRHLLRCACQLVILDVQAFDNSVMRALSLLRKTRLTPLLVLLPEKEQTQIVEIMSIADGFLHKPMDIEICRAVMQSLLRRFDFSMMQPILGISSEDGSLMIHTLQRKAFILNHEISLPRKQYEILCLLASHEGQVFTRSQLLDRVWGHDDKSGDNTLYCQIKKLRNNIKTVNGAPDYIKTVKGVGYTFLTKTN